ncbi:nitroreductase family protein [Desulfopila sp. IMCC35008]|uniref:nitroreductase family protein n=1 Tax=Desulfopila sp. IMCC35008 TaxID=2653858 RepID=UPI0013D08ACD|nr:nitroreductase family protein [Desulfopila sp. IMCC35008]
MNETFDLLMARRSERAYAGKEINSVEKAHIIGSAMRAPTAGNMMLYSILEVEQEQKERLVTTCDNQPFIAKAPLVLVFLADMQRWFDYYTLSGVPEKCRELDVEFETPKEADLMLACCDALIAAQNAVIGAEAMQIGSCYIGDIMENYEIHREMFDLPNWVFPITMVCFGHSLRKERKPSGIPRFPQDAIHFKGKYRRLDADSFELMFHDRINRLKKSGWVKGAENIGQHFYFKKTGSDFFREMRRSVKVAMRQWVK